MAQLYVVVRAMPDKGGHADGCNVACSGTKSGLCSDTSSTIKAGNVLTATNHIRFPKIGDLKALMTGAHHDWCVMIYIIYTYTYITHARLRPRTLHAIHIVLATLVAGGA